MTEFLKRHFSLRHQLVAAVSRAFDTYTYTVRRGLIKGMKRKGGLAFIPFESGPSAEEDFFHHFNFEDLIVYDVGAFEGVMTLFFAKRASFVVSYEPNPRNFRRLSENVALNDLENVRLRNVAVSHAEGSLELSYDTRMPGAGSADEAIVRQMGDPGRHVRSFETEVVSLDEEWARQGDHVPDFVKIDVEGLELSVLRGMQAIIRETKPYIYLEMHGATQAEKAHNFQEIVTFLQQNGYPPPIHIESGAAIDRIEVQKAYRGHLFCIPSERSGNSVHPNT